MKLRIFNMVESTIVKIYKNYNKKEKGYKEEKKNYLNNDNKFNDKGGIGNMSIKYSAIDLANYVITYANQNSKPITNLYLQKILYYIQAEELVTTGEPIFNEPIMAWKYGPVIEEVYYKFSPFGSSVINSERIISELVDIEDDVKVRINHIINEKMKKPAWKLVRETHEEDPWRNTTNDGQNLNIEITIDSIKDFFEKN